MTLIKSPWKLDERGNGKEAFITAGRGNKRLFATIQLDDVDREAALACARAMVAAPELVAVCKALTQKEFAGHNATCICCGQTSHKGHTDSCELIKAKALIAKAGAK